MLQKFRVLCVLGAMVGFPGAAAVRLKVRAVSSAADLHAGPLLRKTPHRSHFLAEMESAPALWTIQEWKRRGIRVTGHIPPSGVVLSAPDNADLRVPGMRWAARLNAADKVSTLVGLDEEAPGAYLVEFYPDVDMDLAR